MTIIYTRFASAGVALLLLLALPAAASAQTTAITDIQARIQSLLAQVTQLQAILTQLSHSSSTPPGYTGGDAGPGATTPVVPVPPSHLGGSQTSDPANDAQCKTWFDGCNSCSRTAPGAMGMCTRMACTTAGTPSCLSRFSGAPIPAVAKNTGSFALACPSLARALGRGDEGDDVAGLQTFLIEHGYLGIGAATGYFGTLTETALQNWQAAKGIVSSGDAHRTGWGLLGPTTRAAIAAACKKTTSTGTPSTGSATPPGYTGGDAGPGATTPVVPVPPSHLGGSQTSDPANDAQCKTWFDGCNSCSRTAPGAMGMCTRMACTTAGTPSCLSRFSSTTTPVPPQPYTDSIPGATLGN
jgi:hypothetical protein